MNSRPATSEKVASTKDVYLWIYWNFESFYRKVLHELSFFDEIQGCVLQVCSFIKTLVHYRLFPQKNTFFIFFKQLVFSIFPKQNLRWILFTAKLQSENVGLQLYWKKLHHRSFPENFPKFCNQLFFLISPFVVKK